MVTRGGIPCLRIKEILTKQIEEILALQSKGTSHKALLVLEITGKIQALVTVEITDKEDLVTADKVMVVITDKE